MIASVLVFLLSKILFFNLSYIFIYIFIFISLIISLFYNKIFRYIIVFLLASSLYQSLLFYISSLIINKFPNIQFPTNTSEFILSIIFGIFSSFFIKNDIIIKNTKKFYIISCLVVYIFIIDYLSYSTLCYHVLICLTIISSRMIFSINIDNTISKRLIFSCIIIMASIFFICNTYYSYINSSQKNIYIYSGSSWCKSTVAYDDNDWTLKSSYSYSLFLDLIKTRHKVKFDDNLNNIKNNKFDIIIFLTPTKKFNEDEIKILDDFLFSGGQIIFIADHTDLYGHARVINAYLKKHGLSFGYDAVFVPHDKYAKSNISITPFSNLRLLTGCNIIINHNTHVMGFLNNFILENADYTRANFFAEMHFTPDDKIGSFPLITTTRVGQGNIVLCSESTIFSNFGIFHPSVLSTLDIILNNYSFLSLLNNLFYVVIILIFIAKFIEIKNLNFIIFILLIMTSKLFFVHFDNSIKFYDNKKIIFVDTDDKMIYEQYNTNNMKLSCSYLLSNLPRFDIYPYYLNEFEKVFKLYNIDLYIGKYINNIYNNKTKILSTVDNKVNSNNIISIHENFSDYTLGNWWCQIGISPLRRDRVTKFSNWILFNKYPEQFVYPNKMSNTGSEEILLKNDSGEEKTIYCDTSMIKNIKEDTTIYIENGVWGLLTNVDDKVILLGGDSFNDLREIPFFNKNWFGVIE